MNEKQSEKKKQYHFPRFLVPGRTQRNAFR